MSHLTPTPLLLGSDWAGDKPGGLNRYLADLQRALRREGVLARAVVVGPALDSPVGTVPASRASRPLPLRQWAFRRAARRLAPQASVVDAHFALYAFGPLLAGGLRPLPLVVHFQGPFADEDFRGGRFPRIRVAVKRRLERVVYRRATAFVTLSAAFKRLLVEGYGVDPWRVQVIPPGVDLARFTPGDAADARLRLDWDDDGPLVVAVRRLVPRMGLDVLLDAWETVSASHPAARLVIVGAGPARAALEAKAAPGSVHFAGGVEEAELVDWYRAADLSVVPSVSLEGFGLVVLESLACGTPVVTTDVGGLPEAVSGLDRSLVVPTRDPAALAARVSAGLAGVEPLPGREKCRRYAETFAWPGIAQRHIDLYDQAVRRTSAPAPGQRLRVVVLDHCARLSGGELALATVLPALRGVDVHVILAEEGPLVARLLGAGISVEVLPLSADVGGVRRDTVRPGRGGLSPVVGAKAAAYTLRLARRLRRLGADVVHTNSLKSALYGGPAARLAGVPAIWHIRDRIAGDYLPRPAVLAVRAMAPRVPAAVIANSAATLATLGPARPGWTVIPSPLGIEVAEASTPSTNGHLRVGIVGRLSPWKGQDLFLEAFATAFPGGQAEAVVVGAALFGEEDYAADLRRRARDLGLDGRVDFRGFRSDICAEIDRLDILVHASKTPEPFGQVVIEGMARGRPVVAAAAGGPLDVVHDGTDGLLYPPGDTAALADRLRQLAADPGLRERLGRQAQSRAQDFTADKIAPLLLDVYRSVAR